MAATGRTSRRSELRFRTNLLPVYSVRQFVIILMLVAVAVCIGSADSQLTNATLVAVNVSETRTPSGNESDSPRENNDNEDESTRKNGSVLLSSEEFVDYTETPTLLFDNTARDDNNASETRAPKQAQSGATGALEAQTTRPSGLAGQAASTSTAAPTSGHAEREDDDDDDDDDDGPADGDNNGDGHASSTSTEQPVAEHPFEKPQNISQYMDYIEKLLHDLRHQIADLFEPHIPQLIRTSQAVTLSSACSFDMLRMAFALRQFEPWALKMIDSSGKLPEGIFEGSFTALGSYDQCLSVAFGESKSDHGDASQGEQDARAPPTQGKYCLVTVSPFMPPKPPVERVERMFQDEANRRNYTQDNQFSRISPMFYYMKFRIGVCIPSSCEQSDMDSIAITLSTNLRLNITIPDCRVKQTDAQLSEHQLVAGSIFGLVLALIAGATLFDCYRQKCHDLRLRELRLLGVNHFQLSQSKQAKASNDDIVIRIGSLQEDDDDDETSISEHDQFLKRLQAHWSWLSFSLMTNFRLYFRPTAKQITATTTTTTHREQDDTREQPIVIKCLNGIRVISLCWVIIANSYLTLDPRATKRLTKTREAPRDFMFQIVAQASLAIETFFFLSGLLMTLSFSRKLKSQLTNNGQIEIESKKTKWLKWAHFYIHRYVRMTPATMLIIALSMYSYHYADGPIWFEATKKAHDSCKQNWWRHMLHVANFIDTRQMCFIHYWYISADMQLFLFAPILLFLISKYKYLGYTLVGLISSSSIFSVFYTTYERNLPPTLLFYSSDPESRREFGNTIMTKPLTHVLPYIVGMLVGQWLATRARATTTTGAASLDSSSDISCQPKQKSSIDTWNYFHNKQSTNLPQVARTTSANGQALYTSNNLNNKLFASLALIVALAEVFLPYKWNNSHLPTRLVASIYASLFRLAWSLVLAFVVISCAHKRTFNCQKSSKCKTCQSKLIASAPAPNGAKTSSREIRRHEIARPATAMKNDNDQQVDSIGGADCNDREMARSNRGDSSQCAYYCFCSSGGNLINQMLSLDIFTHLSRLSFVAYLIHLPLMSLFVQQTRGLFAFSHTLVIHLALSYLVMTFLLAFALVHIIEFPFVTFERLLFERIFSAARRAIKGRAEPVGAGGEQQQQQQQQQRQQQQSEQNAGFDKRHKLSLGRLLPMAGTGAGSSRCYNVNVIGPQQEASASSARAPSVPAPTSDGNRLSQRL